MSEQDYIPGTSVIRNLVDRSPEQPHGTSDQHRLDQVETMRASRRIADLEGHSPDGGKYTFTYMRQVHHHLFQDVYAWAGDPRRVGMAKKGNHYALPQEMNALLRQQYGALAAQNYLRGIADREQFVRQLAAAWGEINYSHAFREGNTRSQTVFFSQLARDAGWQLDVARLNPQHPESLYDEFVEARFEHQKLRSVRGLSLEEASLDLANVLYALASPVHAPQVNQQFDPHRLASRDPERMVKIIRHDGDQLSTIGVPVPTAAPPAAPEPPAARRKRPMRPYTAHLDDRQAAQDSPSFT